MRMEPELKNRKLILTRARRTVITYAGTSLQAQSASYMAYAYVRSSTHTRARTVLAVYMDRENSFDSVGNAMSVPYQESDPEPSVFRGHEEMLASLVNER